MATYTNVAIYGASSYTSAKANQKLIKELTEMAEYNNVAHLTTKPSTATATTKRTSMDERTLVDDNASVHSTSSFSTLKGLLSSKRSDGKDEKQIKKAQKSDEARKKEKEISAMAAATFMGMK